MGKASRKKRERSSEGGRRKEIEDKFRLDLSDFSDSEVNEIIVASKSGMFPPLIVKHKVEKGWTPLHTAIAFEVKTAVSALIKANADINALDNKLITPLHQAVIYATPDYVELLLAAGADAEVRDNHGATALISAIGTGKADMAKVLLQHGVDRDGVDEKFRYTPMHVAAESKNEEMMRLLFDAGVDLTKKDYLGRTAGEVSAFIAGLIEEKQAASLAEKHSIQLETPRNRGGVL